MMPTGLGLRIDTVICEGDRCAVQAESNTTAMNGKKYNNRYHFDIRFEGDKIAEVREYCDTNHAREVFSASRRRGDRRHARARNRVLNLRQPKRIVIGMEAGPA